MIIRTIQDSDLNNLIALYSHLNPKDDTLPTQDKVISVWHEFLDNPIINCFVAEKDGILVASCTLVIVPNLTRGCRPYGLIENVVTHSDYQHQGIGKAIINYTLDYAWQQHCYKVMLMSNSNRHEAHRFYQACGFSSDQKQAFIIKPSNRT